MNNMKTVLIGGLAALALAGTGCSVERSEVRSYMQFGNPEPSPSRPASMEENSVIRERGMLSVKDEYRQMLKENHQYSRYSNQLVELLGEEFDKSVPYFTLQQADGKLGVVAGGYMVEKSLLEKYVNF